MDKWQPIETAPIDKPVLLYLPGYYSEFGIGCGDEEGEWCWNDGNSYSEDEEYYPTHWMPLPEPPEGEDD